MSLDAMLGVDIDKPFNVIGQNFSNPYVITYENNLMLFKSLITGEEIHSWILIKIINGELNIERCYYRGRRSEITHLYHEPWEIDLSLAELIKLNYGKIKATTPINASISLDDEWRDDDEWNKLHEELVK